MSLASQVLGNAGRDNALLVSVDSGQAVHKLLFDCGDGCLGQLPFGEVQTINHLFFSHLHMDHVSGFDTYFRCIGPGVRLRSQDETKRNSLMQRLPYCRYPEMAKYPEAISRGLPTLCSSSSFSASTSRCCWLSRTKAISCQTWSDLFAQGQYGVQRYTVSLRLHRAVACPS